MKKFRNVVIMTLIASLVTVTPAMAAPSIKQIKKNKAASEQKVKNLKKSKAAKEQQLKKANDKLVDLLTDISMLEKDISIQDTKIKKADKDLQKAKAVEEKQYREMLVRIKYMYEKGEDSEAVALLGSEDFGEMMNQAEYIQSVHTYDRKMLNEYKKTKNKVAKMKKNLEAERSDMEVMAEDYRGQKKELNSTISTMKKEVKDFDSQLKAAKEKAAAEARRLEDETRRQQQAMQAARAARASRPSGGSGHSSGGSRRPAHSSSEAVAERPSNTSLGGQIANTGLKYVGNPYVYGGNSLTNGIDCSAFTSQIHALCGVGGVPRTSGAQASGGKYVGSLSNALPGDIVCYSGHVAIYIGGGQIVHASSPSTGIKVNSATYRTIKTIRRYW